MFDFKADDMGAKEIQTTTLEKQDILQFEIHLTAAMNKATITESNNILLARLITNDKRILRRLSNCSLYSSGRMMDFKAKDALLC